MTRYAIGMTAGIFFVFLYPYFRQEIFDELISRGIRTRDIRQKLKGVNNFWLYTEVEAAYGLGMYRKLTCVYLLFACVAVGFHIVLGWWDYLAVLDIVAITLLTTLCSLLILYTRLRVNHRLFESRFLLFGWQARKNKRGMLLEKNYYSTIFDLAYTAFPWIFPILMVGFEKNGL